MHCPLVANRMVHFQSVYHRCFRLVDDVASHVRLFKKARLALKTRNKEDGKIVDLVTDRLHDDENAAFLR